MPYDDSTDTGATDALDNSSEEQTESPDTETQEGQDSGRDDTMFLPEDFPGLDQIKKGQKLVFTVIDPTNREVAFDAQDTPDWKMDLRKSMA